MINFRLHCETLLWYLCLNPKMMTISASKQQSDIAALTQFIPQVSRSTNNTVITQKKICDPAELPAHLKVTTYKIFTLIGAISDRPFVIVDMSGVDSWR